MIFCPNKTPLVFAGNPMLLECTNYDMGLEVCPYSVFIDQKPVYNGKVSIGNGQIVTVDISDVVSDVIPPYPALSGDGWLKPVCAGAAFSAYRVDAKPPGQQPMSADAIPGRLSKQNIRVGRPVPVILKGSPFLTTRTSGWTVYLPEDELMPLYFVWDEVHETAIELVECLHGGSLSGQWSGRGVYALDVAAARREFFDNFYILPSMFELRIGDKAAAVVIITEGTPKESRYKLGIRFLNSFEVPEMICLSGNISSAPAFGGGDDGETERFMRWDSEVSDFESMRNRASMAVTVSIDTDPISSDRLTSLLDMLGAPSVELVGLGPGVVKAIPEAEDLNIALNGNAPQPFTLSFKVCAGEMAVMPAVSSDDKGLPGRLFSDEFNDKFN